MNRIIIACLVLAVLLLGLNGCTPARGTEVATATAQAVSTEAIPVIPATATSAPTSTAAPQQVVLVAAQGSLEGLEQWLADAAAQAGFAFSTLPDLSSGISTEMRVVVLAAPPANLSELAGANPNTRFVVLSGAELAPAANLDVIRLRPESQAFAGGFVSTLLSPDWRSAGLLPGDTGLQDAFVNGGRYYCGVCAPGWPLGSTYPQVAALAGSSAGAEWQAAAAALFDAQKVDVYYVAPEALQPELIQYLRGLEQFGRRVYVVGAQPPPAELAEQWAATLRFDSTGALEQIWDGALAGTAGQAIDAPLLLEDVNNDALGEGRLRLVEEMLADLQAGLIYPFSIPPQ